MKNEDVVKSEVATFMVSCIKTHWFTYWL